MLGRWISYGLVNVTLVGDDGIHLKAHKVILGSSSKVFREMLINSPHP